MFFLCSQGMDSCERYTKSHVTYEPNWESGFNLQIYLVPIIEMLLHWTCTNVRITFFFPSFDLSMSKKSKFGIIFSNDIFILLDGQGGLNSIQNSHSLTTNSEFRLFRSRLRSSNATQSSW